MYTVRLAAGIGGRVDVVVEDNGRHVVGASLSFVRWMHERVPSHQLRPEQAALVAWYDEHADKEELFVRLQEF